MSVFLYHCYESQVAKTYPRTPLPPVTKPRRDRASLEFFTASGITSKGSNVWQVWVYDFVIRF